VEGYSGSYSLHDGGQSVGEVMFDGNGTPTLYAFDGFGASGLEWRSFPALSGGGYSAYTFDPQGNVVQPVTLYPGGNGLSSLRVRTSSSYDGFGLGVTAPADGSGMADPVDPIGFGGQHGYYRDYTGLYLLTHRYYDAGAGRFVNRDPIGYGGGMNLYGFAGNNPVNESDPSGFNPFNPFDTDFGVFGGHDLLSSNNVDFFAGWGSELSMGSTDWVVGQLGAASAVNHNSRAFHTGEAVGFVHGLAFGAAGAGRNTVMQMGRRGRTGARLLRGVSRVASDNRRWNSVRSTWSRSAGGLRNRGQSLHHWLIPQRARWVPQSTRNAGFNYLPLSANFNSWMNGSTAARNVVEWGFKATAGSLYVSPLVYGARHL